MRWDSLDDSVGSCARALTAEGTEGSGMIFAFRAMLDGVDEKFDVNGSEKRAVRRLANLLSMHWATGWVTGGVCVSVWERGAGGGEGGE